MKTSEQINELAAALAKAQGEFENAKKDSDNPYFHSRYADLASCIDAARGPLSANGLAVVQAPSFLEGGFIRMATRLLHCSGQWMESELDALAKDAGPQSVGSVVTYLRRYSLCAMIGLAAEDDDANAGQGVAPKQVAKPAAAKPKQKTEPINQEPPVKESPSSAMDPVPVTINKFKSMLSFTSFRAAFNGEIHKYSDSNDDNRVRQAAVDWIVDYAPKLNLDEHCDIITTWLQENIPDVVMRAVGLKAVVERKSQLKQLAAA